MSALIRPSGTPGLVVKAVRSGRIEAVTSWNLVAELVDVMRRPSIRRYGVTEDDVVDLVEVLKPFLPTVHVDVDVEMRDADDDATVAAALEGRADAIITGDRDFLDDEALRDWLTTRGVAVLAPAELVGRI